jgi:hypothetical protein
MEVLDMKSVKENEKELKRLLNKRKKMILEGKEVPLVDEQFIVYLVKKVDEASLAERNKGKIHFA